MASLQLESVERDGILEITLSGAGATAEEADAIAATVIQIIAGARCDLALIDCRQVQGRLGFGALYYHVHNYPKTLRRWVKTAVVDLKEYEVTNAFFQTLTANLGLCITWFDSIEKAREWLESK